MKTAIITGASSGMGKSFVKKLALGNENFDEVWILARRAERLDELKLLYPGKKLIPVVTDLTDRDALAAFGKLLEEKKPTISLLVNCAGLGKRGDVASQPSKALEDTLEINCVSLSVMIRICLPYMQDNGGRIINIASSAAYLPQPGFACYAASKSYVLNFSRALAYELKSRKITVTAVCPGPVATEFLSKATDNKETDFTGFRKYFVADSDAVAEASIKAANRGKKVMSFGFSQKCLHFASKIVPTDLILMFETMGK